MSHPSDIDARRYLGRLAAVGLGLWVAAALYIELFPINFFTHDYARWRVVMDYMREPGDETLLILGDSRAKHALQPAVLGPQSRSLALVGTSPLQAYFVLRGVLEAGGRPRTLVVGFGPKHFYRARNVFWHYTALFKFLTLPQVREVARRARELEDPLLDDPRRIELHWLAVRANLLPFYVPSLVNGGVVARRGPNLRKVAELERTRGAPRLGRETTSRPLSPEARHRDFRPAPLLDAYFGDLLELAAENGIDVIYRTMPLTASTGAALTPAYRASYRSWLEGWAARHPGFDIPADIPLLPDDHFGDDSHVNRRGADRVSAEVAEVLARRGAR